CTAGASPSTSAAVSQASQGPGTGWSSTVTNTVGRTRTGRSRACTSPGTGSTLRPGSRSRTTEPQHRCSAGCAAAAGSDAQGPAVAAPVDHLRQPDEGFAEAPDARSCARDRAQNEEDPVVGGADEDERLLTRDRVPRLRAVGEPAPPRRLEHVDDASGLRQSEGTAADSDRRLLPSLDAGRVAPDLTGPGFAPAADLDVEAAADLDLPVQQLLGAAVEGDLPASHEVRGFEAPVAIGALDPPRREGIGE